MLESRGGIGSITDGRNPVANWTRVFVPYCTGDAHCGNKTASYGIHHKGFANAHTAVQWAYKNAPSPDTVFVTGISAGAVASYVWAPWLFSHYKDAAHYHLADSYAPVFGKTGYAGGLKNWDMAGAYDVNDIPTISPGSLQQWHPLVAAANTNNTAFAFPKATFASYVSNTDTVEQTFYVTEGGGVDGFTWKKAMRDALGAIDAPNYAKFVAAGSQHGVIDGDSLYSKASYDKGSGNKVVLGDWLRDMLSGKRIPMEVDCLGHGC
eukprot:g4789.t1